ncbi:MAG TPA: pilus assembly protein N-terminal domain-containing protein, partial [Pirellulaceae bacterium]|nr:pilus assembly protein N-terminal domain-containing protein [Pirellulaceae bacterium]
MLKARATAATVLGAIVSIAIGLGSVTTSNAQTLGRQPVHFKVSGPVERLEMIVNTSRILTTEHKVPQLLVENQGVVRAQPISPNQVQLSALKAGFTTLTVWDENQGEHTIDVLVYGDARELENLLMTEFPEATLRVRPLASSVVISGYVPRAEMVSRIVRMAEDYYPSVINNITIGGVQQILLHVKLMEVSRTKLRQLGFDWANFSGDDFVVQSVAGLISSTNVAAGTATSSGGDTVAFGIVNDANSFFGFIDALRQYNLVKVLAEPTLVTVSGRPASFSSGGEFPIIVPQSLGTVSIEYRQFGTRVDFVPIVLGNGRVRLEVRPQVSEIDPARSVTINNTTVPGLRTRWVDTGVEMKAGQTLALAGLIQTQVESTN